MVRCFQIQFHLVKGHKGEGHLPVRKYAGLVTKANVCKIKHVKKLNQRKKVLYSGNNNITTDIGYCWRGFMEGDGDTQWEGGVGWVSGVRCSRLFQGGVELWYRRVVGGSFWREVWEVDTGGSCWRWFPKGGVHKSFSCCRVF